MQLSFLHLWLMIQALVQNFYAAYKTDSRKQITDITKPMICIRFAIKKIVHFVLSVIFCAVVKELLLLISGIYTVLLLPAQLLPPTVVNIARKQ